MRKYKLILYYCGNRGWTKFGKCFLPNEGPTLETLDLFLFQFVSEHWLRSTLFIKFEKTCPNIPVF